MKENFYVYCHRRKTDGKCFYIGKGTTGRYREKSNRNRYWKNVVNKHGFEAIILINNINEEKAFELEFKISEQFGWENLTNLNREKGNGGHSMSEKTKSILYTKERNIKISNSLKGRKITWEKGGLKNKGNKLSEESKQKISLSKKGHKCYKNPNFSKKISKALKGRETKWIYKPILQYDLEGNFIREFISQKQAEDFLKCKKGSISACCNNRQKTAYNYIWKFKTN